MPSNKSSQSAIHFIVVVLRYAPFPGLNVDGKRRVLLLLMLLLSPMRPHFDILMDDFLFLFSTKQEEICN